MTPVPTAAYDANGNILSDAQGRSFTWDLANGHIRHPRLTPLTIGKDNPARKLCLGLCRNPSIPAGISPCRSLSLAYR